MSSRPTRRGVIAAALLVLGACAAGESLLGGGLEPPVTLTATPLNLTTIRLDWLAPPAGDLQLFRIQRRSDFRGAFRTLAEVTPGTTTYFDSELEPATFYGYRIVAVDRLGESSGPSVVAGAQTPPFPGIRISTSLSGSPAGSADPNGYLVRVTGPRDTTVAVGSVDARVLSPLPVGTYTLTLEDVAPTCAIQGGASRTVVVSDTGLATQPPAAFDATCVDPTRGTVVAVVAVDGDSVDADGYRLDFAGIISGDTLPVLGGTGIAGVGEGRSFPNLRPGDYQFTLSGVDAPCQLAGPASRTAQVTPLSLDTLNFTVTCPEKGGGDPTAPFVLRNLWTPQAGGAGGTVTLEVSLDLSAVPGENVGSVQASLQYNASVLAYVSATAPAPALMNNLTVNAATPGTVSWLNFTTGSTPPTGLVPVARFTFTVQGSTGQTAATRTAIQTIGNFDGSATLEDQFRVVEDTFTVGTGGGGGGNLPPVAEAGGPYSGTVGAAISFSSAGSSDPDGTIAGYSWNFGDGTSSTQASPQKSYQAAGTYTATLTVTDNQGATASDPASVTVTGGGGGGNQPLTWSSAFGAFNTGLGTYPLVITLNLTQDIAQTPGPEALASYVVDSLVWDPAVLEYHSLVYASGGGSINPTNATGGCKCKLSFTGVGLSPNTGIVPVATVNFRPVGASGSSTTPRFHLASVLSTAPLGTFNYLAVLQQVAGSLTLP